jgi:ankyrin repeat protein
MPKYQVYIEGRNFLLELYERHQKLGFYTQVFVEAQDDEGAESNAMEVLLRDTKLRERVLNSKEDRPTMTVGDLKQIGSFDGLILPHTKLIFFSAEKEPIQHEFVEAILEGNIDRVKEAHLAGASVSQPDRYGWLPIHRAATAGRREDILQMLIAWGSPLEAMGTEDWTPLHLASVSRSHRAVAALLKAGANIDARSVYGSTPLHLAIGPTLSEELLETVRVLISFGAAIDAQDEKGKTPLDEAMEIQNQELLRIFKDDGRS